MSDSSNKSNSPGRRTVRVAALARVEGEGALHLEMEGTRVREVRLEIFEPPRFYEAFLRGRDYQEVPDITARICGICPVAYQMGCCHALEKALGVYEQIYPSIHALRTLLYCGEWIESHVLHMFMLHLPDFLGFESAISMAEKHGPLVRRALNIKKTGNEIVALLGGRSVHPVGVCVGGFHRAPDVDAVTELRPRVKSSLDDMCDLTLQLARQIRFPELDRDYEFLSLYSDREYPMNLGRIRTNKGLDIEQEEFLNAMEEHQVPHSNAMHARLKQRGAYLVGPLARLNLCHSHLHPAAAEVLNRVCAAIHKPLPWNNNYFSLMARAVETVHALAVACDVLGGYRRPDHCRVPTVPRAGRGSHGTEAPRGFCWHHYETGADGTITQARIIPPTSQNQSSIEDDLRQLAERLVDVADEEAALSCEHLIRNYDPCISCSVHFLKFRRTWRNSQRHR